MLIDQQVFWFNVSVNDAYFLMQVLKTIHELLEKVPHERL